MSILYHERPGVYSDYSISGLTATSAAAKVVALVGASAAAKGLYTVTSLAAAQETFGKDSVLGEMILSACQNGAGKLLVYSLQEQTPEAWQEGIAAVLAEKEAAYCAVGSTEASVHALLKEAVVAASKEKGECIGVVVSGESDADTLIRQAQALDCERMVLVGPDCYLAGENRLAGTAVAAAFCGMLSCQQDPALPLHGAELQGFDAVAARYEEREIDLLVQGGVTVLEAIGGKVQILRGVTTKKTAGEDRDTTFRDLNTILVMDDVIPGIRKALSLRFPRNKNNAATRAAICNQVTVELENRLRREIIDGYENVKAEASKEDPAVCLVQFGFSVTRGLSRICLTAHIMV